MIAPSDPPVHGTLPTRPQPEEAVVPHDSPVSPPAAAAPPSSWPRFPYLYREGQPGVRAWPVLGVAQRLASHRRHLLALSRALPTSVSTPRGRCKRDLRWHRDSALHESGLSPGRQSSPPPPHSVPTPSVARLLWGALLSVSSQVHQLGAHLLGTSPGVWVEPELSAVGFPQEPGRGPCQAGTPRTPES